MELAPFALHQRMQDNSPQRRHSALNTFAAPDVPNCPDNQGSEETKDSPPVSRDGDQKAIKVCKAQKPYARTGKAGDPQPGSWVVDNESNSTSTIDYTALTG